jgi:hypothetical protein
MISQDIAFCIESYHYFSASYNLSGCLCKINNEFTFSPD